MQKEKIHSAPFSILIALIVLWVDGCASLGKNEFTFDRAVTNLPRQIKLFYEQAKEQQFENLDSLALFVNENKKYSALDEEVRRYQSEKKYMPDFALAYDGDSAAFTRLMASMNSQDDWEVLRLFFGLAAIDTVRPATKLRELISTSDGMRKNFFLQALQTRETWNAYNIKYKKEIDSSRQNTKPKLNERFNQPGIENLLNRGIPNDVDVREWFMPWSDVFSYVVHYGNMDQYCRMRNILTQLLPAAEAVSWNDYFSSSLLNLMTSPAPGDTANNIQDIKNILQTISSELCSTSESASNGLPKRSIAIIARKDIDSSLIRGVCNQCCVANNDSEVQRIANRKGAISCQWLYL